jgi:glycerophosphoryl diester phosphodiesterase
MLRIGHRGAAALAPENTVQSLTVALELGCDLVELDVLDVEGTLVLAHSASSSRRSARRSTRRWPSSHRQEPGSRSI